MASFMAALHQRATTPFTPTHSPHPSLHSRSSISSHPQSLSLHDYRKQLSLPCTPDFAGSKRVKRKTAASSLKTATHAPQVTFAEVDQLSVGGKGPPFRTILADEAQPLLEPPSPESPVTDPFRRTRAGDVPLTSLQDASNLLERPLGFGKKLASRKRLPHPNNIKLAHALPRDSIYSDPSSTDLHSSAGLSESSSFTLSKYPFPLPPSRVQFERFSNIDVLPASPHPKQDISFVLPDTPPATPATLHYRGASFDLVNPRKSLFHSNFEPPEDPDVETGNELVDRLPTLKGLLPGDMAGDSEHLRKEAAHKPDHQSRKIFDDLESAYASIAHQKAHGSRDSIIQSPERRMVSVEALTSPPVAGKRSEAQTPRSVSAGHPASTLSSPSKTPRGTSFMNRVKDKFLRSPTKIAHEKEQELQDLNSDGTPTKNPTLNKVSEEALLPINANTGNDEEVEDRSSLHDSAWESISEQPTEPRYSLAPSSIYPESKRASRPYSLAASSIYQDSGMPPNSAFFGPISNRRSVPWGVRNQNTDYSTEMSMTEDMWQYGSPRNSLQADHGHSQVNDTTLGSIIDRYGNETSIGRPTGSSIAASFDNGQHDSLAAGQTEGIIRFASVQCRTPEICLEPEVAAVAQFQDPESSSAKQSPVNRPPEHKHGQLPKLQTNVAESRVGAPPLQSPPPLVTLPQHPFFPRGSTELLSGQGSYGDTSRLLNMFPIPGSSVSELSTARHLSPQLGDGLPESPLQSIIDQCSAQSSPMERQDPFYLEDAAKQHRDSWESCSTQSSGGGILGEASISRENRPPTPMAQTYAETSDAYNHHVLEDDEIPAIWARKVSPNAKSQRFLHIDATDADIPTIWARKVSPNAKSQRSFPSQLGHGASCEEAERMTEVGGNTFRGDSPLDHGASRVGSPVQGKGKQALRRKPSFEQLSPNKSVAADLIPKRTDTNPWRNRKKSTATDSPVKTPGKSIPRFPRESQLLADSLEGDLSRAFPTEDELRAGSSQLRDRPQWSPTCPPELLPDGLGHRTPESNRQLSSPNAPLLGQRSFERPSSSPLAHKKLSPTYLELRSPTSSRTPLLPGHRHFKQFYSPTADGIDAALSAPSTTAAVFPGAAGNLLDRAVSRTSSRYSNLSSPSLTPSTGDHRLDDMREMRRLRPRASVHYDETLMQRRMEERRRISEKLDAKNLAEPPMTSLRTGINGGVINPLHPRAAVRGQRSVLPLRLRSDSAINSTASFGTQVRHNRSASDVEAARMPWSDRLFLTPTTVGAPARYRSPRLSDMPRPERPLFEDSPKRQEQLSWKIFWIFGLFPPFGLLIYTGHFDTLMPYFTEGEVESIGNRQKKIALAVALGECAGLLFTFWVLKMVDVV